MYTGKTRLARNVLQDVLRNWHSRDAKIMKTMNDLIQNAKDSEEAIRKGKLKHALFRKPVINRETHTILKRKVSGLYV